jgi:uncharacterized membrane protein YccC
LHIRAWTVRSDTAPPAFSIKNTEAIALALKAGLGLELCYVLMHALSWGALVTAGVSAVLVSQTSLGAIVQKSMLRLGGAVLGGALGIATIVVAMPNLQSLGSLLIVAGLGFLVAGRIAVGSSRISYLGLQTGMAFAMCVTDPTPRWRCGRSSATASPYRHLRFTKPQSAAATRGPGTAPSSN